MGYKFWCQSCGHNYYTVGSGTWYTSGTVTRYPSYGYCRQCCGQGYTSWSWSGNVVKLECRGCSNLIGIVRWCDWKGRSGERTGFCSGCHTAYKREQERKRKEEKERARKARQARQDSAQQKPHYCPPSYSFSAPSWASTQLSQHSIDTYNYLWKSIQIICEAKCHTVIYEQDMNSKYAGQTDRNNTAHHDIVKLLSESECPTCKHQEKEQRRLDEEKQKAKRNANRVDNQLDALLARVGSVGHDSGQTTQNDDGGVALKDIPSLIQDIDAEINAATKQLEAANNLQAQIDAVPTEVDYLLSGIENTPTFVLDSEYQDTVNKIQTKVNELTAKKKNLRQREKKAMEKENDLLDEQNKLNNAKKKANKEKSDLDESRTKLDSLKLDITKCGICAANVGQQELNNLNRKFQEAYTELLTKYADNEKQTKALNECQQRMKKIRARIMADRSQCQYLIELLDAECMRLNEASDKAMAKFEQRSKYFLSVTCALPQDVVSKFIDDEGYELEDILELTEQDLKDLGLNKGGVRKKVMRQIQALKQSST